jgi:hypothetical protein
MVVLRPVHFTSVKCLERRRLDGPQKRRGPASLEKRVAAAEIRIPVLQPTL